ncbi:MAG: SAM-dependent methyltransferase [Candidatus Tantalella remota]|nr:SAM-dependent methyltransferase [Candidatus Tantalella remota]
MSEIFYWLRNDEFHVWVITRDGFIIDAYPRDKEAPRVIRQGEEGDEYKGDHISKVAGSVDNKKKWDEVSEFLEMPRKMEEIASRARQEAGIPEIWKIEDAVKNNVDVKDGNKTWGYYAPTPTVIALQVLMYMKALNPDAKFCDIGSGKGQFAFLAAAAPSVRFPSVTGIEIRETLHAGAVESQEELAGTEGIENITFVNGNFLEEDLSEYDVLYFFYTNPTDMSALEFNRILREKMVSLTGMKPGARWVVWGDVEAPISDDEELSHEIIPLGKRAGISGGLSVYTRHDTGSAARQGTGEDYPEKAGRVTGRDKKLPDGEAEIKILEQTVPQKESVMLRRLNEWFYRFKATKTFSDVFSTSASRGSPWTRTEAERFARQLDQMDQHGELPEVITVYEIGCGNCRFAGEFLSYLQELRPAYYKRISYVIGDFSPEMLKEASKTPYIKSHLEHVSFVEVDATGPLPFTEPAVLIRANELLDDLMPMQLLKKENGKFYEMQVEVSVEPLAEFKTRDGEMVERDSAVRWMRENDLEQLAGLDPSFLENIEISETWSLIEDITDYPYGEMLREAYEDVEYAEIPHTVAAFDFTQRVVQHLYPGYGQFVAYDYGIYKDSMDLTGIFRRYGGQPTMDVNFLLLEKILEEKLGAGFVRIQRQPENMLYSDGLDSVLGRNFYRMEAISPLSEEKDRGGGDPDQAAQKFIDSLINWIEARAIETGIRGEKLVIGIDTSWIPETQLDLAGMQQLLASIRNLSTGRLKGFENIEVCISDDPRALADTVWDARRSKDPKASLTPLSNVVILGDEDVLDAELFRSFKGNAKEDSAFFAKVVLPEDLSEETDIDLLAMVTEMLEMVSSADPDSPREFYVEIPDADKVPLHRLTEIYEARSKALTAA